MFQKLIPYSRLGHLFKAIVFSSKFFSEFTRVVSKNDIRNGVGRLVTSVKHFFQKVKEVFFLFPLPPIAKKILQKRPKLFLKGFTIVFWFFPKRKKIEKKRPKSYFSIDLLLFFDFFQNEKKIKKNDQKIISQEIYCCFLIFFQTTKKKKIKKDQKNVS